MCTANHSLNNDRNATILDKLDSNAKERHEMRKMQEDEAVRVTDITRSIEEQMDKNYVEMGTLIEEVRV